MKKLLFLSVIMLTFAGLQAQSCKLDKQLLFGAAVGVSNKGEFAPSIDIAIIKPHPGMHLSVGASVFTEKDGPNTVTVGPRLNRVLPRNTEKSRLVLFAGGTYVTQGAEKRGQINEWAFQGGANYLYQIQNAPDYDAWLKIGASYLALPQYRIFYSFGIQGHF